MNTNHTTAVIALGGNAIDRPGEVRNIHSQFANTRASLAPIIELSRMGYRIALTHGNGPQVGDALLRVELAADKAPIVPLGVLVADTQGSMGYMIEQSLQNRLLREGLHKEVVTLVTQVLVDKNDPSISNPTKYVGQVYTREEAERFATERGWTVKEDPGRGWRRVVPSPIPLRILNSNVVRELLDKDRIVICVGGGGVPIYLEADGTYEGMDAVIDKDRASAVLAREIEADLLLILTAVDRVCIDFKKPTQRELPKLSLAEARKFLADGQFPPGSMGPKIEAACTFLEQGGKRVIITSVDKAHLAVGGATGTVMEV